MTLNFNFCVINFANMPIFGLLHSQHPVVLLTLSACTRVTVLIYLSVLHVCHCVTVSLTTLEATLIYSAKNHDQWTAKFKVHFKAIEVHESESKTDVTRTLLLRQLA